MSQRWNIDTSHSGIHFTVRHMVIAKVRGAFERFEGVIEFDEKSPASSKVNVTIEAASINTREPKRDAHLKSADFFNTEKYPTLTFTSTRVEKTGEQTFRLEGELTLHGVTKSVVLDAEYLGAGKDPWGNQRAAFHAKTRIERRDFGLNWNQALEAGGVLVGDDIDISLDVEAVAAVAQDKVA